MPSIEVFFANQKGRPQGGRERPAFLVAEWLRLFGLAQHSIGGSEILCPNTHAALLKRNIHAGNYEILKFRNSINYNDLRIHTERDFGISMSNCLHTTINSEISCI